MPNLGRPPEDPVRRNRPRIVVSWSSGKDAAYALYELQHRREYRVVGLLTTVTGPFARVSMHGVRVELLEAQAAHLGLPLHQVEIPSPCTNTVYEERMGRALERLKRSGVAGVAFGDLFLADVRAYREDRMRGTGLEPLFPLWGRPTDRLAREMIAAGFRATLVCVDPKQLSKDFAGREFDEALLRDLPRTADPCGERGEFHTFVHDGPIFRGSIPVVAGPVVEREGFVFADLTPGDRADRAITGAENRRPGPRRFPSGRARSDS
jgi:uncharacterized protein (TIGR00290 family)